MRKSSGRASPEDCADAVLDCLRLTARFLISSARGSTAGYQLTPPQFRVLDYLRSNPGASLSEVADHLGVRQPTASVTVFRLVRDKLVRRATDPSERRRIALNLTDQGSKLIGETRSALRRRLSGMLAEIKPNDLSDLAAGLAVLNAALAQHSA